MPELTCGLWKWWHLIIPGGEFIATNASFHLGLIVFCLLIKVGRHLFPGMLQIFFQSDTQLSEGEKWLGYHFLLINSAKLSYANTLQPQICVSNPPPEELIVHSSLWTNTWRSGAFQVALVVKNLPANAGKRHNVRSLVQKDPLEEGMATHSSILAWRIPWAKDLEDYGPQCLKQLNTTELT